MSWHGLESALVSARGDHIAWKQIMRPKQNPKRKLSDLPISEDERTRLKTKVSYVGSPYHKRNPGDFGLKPPSAPRPDKTECDSAGITTKAAADALLEQGINAGLISPYEPPELPRYIWAVANDNTVVEARLDNETSGTYHGYPLSKDDPWSRHILETRND